MTLTVFTPTSLILMYCCCLLSDEVHKWLNRYGNKSTVNNVPQGHIRSLKVNCLTLFPDLLQGFGLLLGKLTMENVLKWFIHLNFI